MAFVSKFKANDKLKACAENDRDHIGENTYPASDRAGEHVALIHEALHAWVLKASPPVAPVAAAEASEKRFGPDTARLVIAFKTRNNILNYAGRIDPIVGKKTVAALDLQLASVPDPDPPPEPPKTPGKADVVVRFIGAHAAGDATPDQVIIPRRIVVYKEMLSQPHRQKVLLNPLTDRVLVRIGRKTTTIGAESTPVFASVMQEFVSIIGSVQRTIGKIYVFGSSSGGRNAIDFGRTLSLGGFPPEMVIAVDAAFFQTDTPSRPEANVDHPLTVPKFSVDAGRSAQRFNFFHTRGNHAKRSLTHGILFTSRMAGEEIHGEITGFMNFDVTRFIRADLEDDDAHGECIKHSNPRAEDLIVSDILLK